LKNNEVEQSVTEMCAPLAAERGMALVQVRYLREAYGWVLRVLVERVGGAVTVEDCSGLSRELSDLLDVEDLVDGSYNLEVSSPGLDRPLTGTDDFKRFAGRFVNLKTSTPIDGRRNFTGRLVGLDSGTVTIDVDGTTYELEYPVVERANLVPNFDEPAST